MTEERQLTMRPKDAIIAAFVGVPAAGLALLVSSAILVEFVRQPSPRLIDVVVIGCGASISIYLLLRLAFAIHGRERLTIREDAMTFSTTVFGVTRTRRLKLADVTGLRIEFLWRTSKDGKRSLLEWLVFSHRGRRVRSWVSLEPGEAETINSLLAKWSEADPRIAAATGKQARATERAS